MNYGFIGAGNMGGAIMRGCIAKNAELKKSFFVSDFRFEAAKKLADEIGVNVCKTNNEVVKNSDYVLLAVKPQVFVDMAEGIKKDVTNKQIIVSIAAGISIKTIEGILGKDKKIVRIMPNTPAMVNEGMASLSRNKNITDEDMKYVSDMFNLVGKTEEVDEKLIDVVSGVSGCTPAYVYMFIEALADGAVLQGMARDKAYKFAAQAVKGSAEMVLETGIHPGALKDMVCSPGGVTIQAVRSLERDGMRSAVIEAVNFATEISQKMTKEAEEK